MYVAEIAGSCRHYRNRIATVFQEAHPRATRNVRRVGISRFRCRAKESVGEIDFSARRSGGSRPENKIVLRHGTRALPGAESACSRRILVIIARRPVETRSGSRDCWHGSVDDAKGAFDVAGCCFGSGAPFPRSGRH